MLPSLVLSNGTLKKGQLIGLTALITGAGGGIGYETARSLAWLGAKLIIAEIDKRKGKKAEQLINDEFGKNTALFIPTDISSKKSVIHLAKVIRKKNGTIDVLINNATITPIGSVHQVGSKAWDCSYAVNIRGPVLLIEQFLPPMLERKKGVIVFIPSSGAAPYMGAYEIFKTAQVELSNTLVAELEGTGVITYSVGPGIVKTETAQKAIELLAPLYGKSTSEFYLMNEKFLLSSEEAGAGIAASIALANIYNGQEIGSIQALNDAGINISNPNHSKIVLDDNKKAKMLFLLEEIVKTFTEQADGWNSRIVFERQWLLRDFKKCTGLTPKELKEELLTLIEETKNNYIEDELWENTSVAKLYSFYKRQLKLLEGYEKDPNKLKLHKEIINQWLDTVYMFKELYAQVSSSSNDTESRGDGD